MKPLLGILLATMPLLVVAQAPPAYGATITIDTTADDAGDSAQSGGGDMVVASTEFRYLDPHFTFLPQDVSLHRMIWRGLYTLDKHNVPRPAMAARPPKISSDGLTYTITLRSGLQWSDGDDLTAEDFEAGIKRVCNPVIGAVYEHLLRAVAGCHAHYTNGAFSQALEDAIGVNALGPKTLRIDLLQPQPTLTMILALWMTFPTPVHLVATTSSPWPSSPGDLAYNGPYSLVQHVANSHAVLAPNPNWAAPAGVRPSLDSLTIRFIDDPALAAAQFDSGQIDFANVDTSQLPGIPAQHPDEYVSQVAAITAGFGMTLNHPVLSNLNVRLALSKSIDRKALIQAAFNGGAEPTTTWLPEVTNGPEPDVFEPEIGYDPTSAAEHLAAAGYPGGAGFPTLRILSSSAFEGPLAAFLQQSFQNALAIQTEIVTGGSFELDALAGWREDYPDPENWIVEQFKTGGAFNVFGCSDPDIDTVIAAAVRTTSKAQRIRLYQQANSIIVRRLCGLVPYAHLQHRYLIDTDIKGMRENMSPNQDAAIAADWNVEEWSLQRHQ